MPAPVPGVPENAAGPSRSGNFNGPRRRTPRNLVVCIDGTSNKFGRKNTNVVKLYKQIKLDEPDTDTHPQQRAYYSSGIGTHAKKLPFLLWVEKVISDSFDMALAWNVEENVKDAYGWLAREYQEGDQIYLFGFSRGAYQVRVLAGLIHEVGLIRTPTEKQTEMAFGHYRSIHPHKPETREMAIEFKKTYSWQKVRIHFVGVWDTVSSIGLIKGDVFVSTSASATNASHFRHALALDERRVKFMPEYFREVNAHRNNRLRPNTDSDSDIKEVWFSGCHADVGGVSRLGQPYHAGNISLSWMQCEASENGLILKPSDLTWVPEDFHWGRNESLSIGWKVLEILFPFRHQVSFSGAGKNKLTWHWFQPRRIIPGQRIHASVWCGDTYRPRANLGTSIKVPTLLRSSRWVEHSGLPETETSRDDVETADSDLVPLLAWVRRYAAHELGYLLECGLKNPTPTNKDDWFRHIGKQSDFDRFIAVAAYVIAFLDIDGEIETEVNGLLEDAKRCLNNTLIVDHPDLARALSFLPHLMKNKVLRHRIVDLSNLISALTIVLDLSLKNPNERPFSLVVDGLSLLMQEADLAKLTVDQLMREYLPGKSSGLSMLSRMLETNNSTVIITSLRIIILLVKCLREHDEDSSRVQMVRQELKPKIETLAKKRSGSIGLMAAETFEVLFEQGDKVHGLRFSNILAYLGSTAWLDVEGGDSDSLKNAGPPRLIVNESGSDDQKTWDIDEHVHNKIITSIGSRNAKTRIAATLTFLKLCRYQDMRHCLLDESALNAFIKQLKRNDASLLAAYALKTCLEYSQETVGPQSTMISDTLTKIAPHIVTMFKKGWFDDSVGLVEGFEIFRQLMKHDILKKAIETGVLEALRQKLEDLDQDGIRTSLCCLDVLNQRHLEMQKDLQGSDPPSLVKDLVDDCLKCLRKKHWQIQARCVNVLSALSQTVAGEKVICGRVNEIVGLLLPEYYWDETDKQKMKRPEQPTVTNGIIPVRPNQQNRPVPPSKMLGPSYALYTLSRNESIRSQIRQCERYATLKGRYPSGSLFSGPDTPLWRIRTPNKNDVLMMIARMIKAVDEGFSYDGLGSVPETIPVVILHLSGLGILLRDSVARALRLLPGLAIGLIQGTTIVVSRSAHKLQRRTNPDAHQREDDIREHTPRSQRTSRDDAGVTCTQTSPTHDQPTTTSQSGYLASPENQPERVDIPGHITREREETFPQNPDIQTTTLPPPPITGESSGPSNEWIVEESRTEGLPISTPRAKEVRFGPIPTKTTGVSTVQTPMSGPSSQVNVGSPIAEEQRDVQTTASSSRSPSSPSITLKDFRICDLPTKKCLNMIPPRARLRVRVGNQTFVSPAVKIGNQSEDEGRSWTHWEWNIPQPTPASDEEFEIMVERRFLLWYTCIRHVTPTTIRKMKQGHGHHSGVDWGLPLVDGPPTGDIANPGP